MEISMMDLIFAFIISFGMGVISIIIIFIFGMKKNAVSELEEIKKLISDFLYQYHNYEGKK